MIKLINITVHDEDTFWNVSNLILLKSHDTNLLFYENVAQSIPKSTSPFKNFRSTILSVNFAWLSRPLQPTWSPHLTPVAPNNFFWPGCKGRNRTCYGSFRTKCLLISQILYLRKYQSCKLLEAGGMPGGSISAVSFVAALWHCFWLLDKERRLDKPLVYPSMVILKLPNRLSNAWASPPLLH